MPPYTAGPGAEVFLRAHKNTRHRLVKNTLHKVLKPPNVRRSRLPGKKHTGEDVTMHNVIGDTKRLAGPDDRRSYIPRLPGMDNVRDQ